MNNDTIRERVAPALQEAMEPGEKIIAGAAAVAGPSPVAVGLAALVVGLAPVIGLLGSSGLMTTLQTAGAAVAVGPGYRQRPAPESP
jgi:hypothetical protein